MTTLPNVSTVAISLEGKSPKQIAALYAWRTMYANQLAQLAPNPDKRVAASLKTLIAAYDAALPVRAPKPKGPPADMHVAGYKAALTRLTNKLPGLKGSDKAEVTARIAELKAIIADPSKAASRKSADPLQAMRDELNAARRDSAAKEKAVKPVARKSAKAAKADPAPATEATRTEATTTEADSATA
jgi:hypothetical protein